MELLLEPGVALEDPVLVLGIAVPHVGARDLELVDDAIEAPCPEDPVATTFRSPVRGSWGRYATGTERRTEPPAGRASPASTLARVVLPAPLRPTSPILSPGAT